ncbi:MAG: aconitase X catalytic domain-containing protein [Pseudomonadota bacterium]
MELDAGARAILSGATGTAGDRMALEIVTGAARMLGAPRLVEIASAHIDGCLYHGASGTLFCEKLAAEGARVSVPATTNVGALNLLKPDQCRLSPEDRPMAYRLMVAHERMGCRPSWTCAPYQVGARPAKGEQIAWGESNAVAFANSVLGARTNRYGDFLDIACAIAGRAPYYGLHVPENRRARLVLDATGLPDAAWRDAAVFSVLGALVGRLVGDTVCAIDGVPPGATDDDLKALCAAAAATGAVALIHVVGTTPEAPDLATALGDDAPEDRIAITPEMLRGARAGLSLAPDGPIDSVALGSPHFSVVECRTLLRLAEGTPFRVPVHLCLGRHALDALAADGTDRALESLGVTFVADTCVVVTPILPDAPGVLMTNSAKFAHYAPGNTGHLPVFGTLAECVASAQAGHVVRA